jgi:hypothetical protein
MASEEIRNGEDILAIMIRNGSVKEPLAFPSPASFPLQLGIHNRKKEESVIPHFHLPLNLIDEKIKELSVQEFIYLESGKIQVEVYDHQGKLFKQVVLLPKDMIMLNSGHSISFLEDSRIIEIKQGPYRGKEKEKVYFEVKK